VAYSQAWLRETRARLLADPANLALALDPHLELEWFHRLWLEWTVRHPFSMIEGPRGFGKSYIATVIMAIWWILRDFDTRILIVSKTDDAAKAFVNQIRGILETNALLKACFGHFVGTAVWRDDKLQVAQRKAIFAEGTVEARGLGGQVTRTHWNHIFLDDLHDLDRAESEEFSERDARWLDEVLMPTVLPGGTVSVRATCYAWDDLRGRIEERAGEENIFDAENLRLGGGPLPNAKWRVLKVGAILRDGSSLWESRFPLHDRVLPDGSVFKGLVTIRAENERAFERQYQQICRKPKEGERGTVFNVSLFKAWDQAPDATTLRLVMRHDPAWTSREEAAKRTSRDRRPDFTAITVAGRDFATGRCYILEHFRGHLSDKEGIEKARDIALRWKPLGLRRYRVERTGLLLTQAPDFYRRIRDAMPVAVEFVNPQKNKVAHAEPLALAILHDRVRWNPAIFEQYPDLRENFDLFPTKGVPDDDIDSIAGAFLMGERTMRSLAAHVRQAQAGGGGVLAPSADTDRRLVRPSLLGGMSARIVQPGTTGFHTARAVPPRGQ